MKKNEMLSTAKSTNENVKFFIDFENEKVSTKRSDLQYVDESIELGQKKYYICVVNDFYDDYYRDEINDPSEYNEEKIKAILEEEVEHMKEKIEDGDEEFFQEFFEIYISRYETKVVEKDGKYVLEDNEVAREGFKIDENYKIYNI